jgi:hypothetical protein
VSFYRVTHTHTSCIEAQNEECAKGDLVQQVRDNADESDCESEEITAEEFERHWEAQGCIFTKKGGAG